MNSENIYMRDCYWRRFDDSKPVGVSMKIGNGYFFRGVGGLPPLSTMLWMELGVGDMHRGA